MIGAKNVWPNPVDHICNVKSSDTKSSINKILNTVYSKGFETPPCSTVCISSILNGDDSWAIYVAQ